MLVSVIVPVYKAEKWLHRCVDSILAQTMEDFELLLIDDGSPDRSGEICDEYAAKDSRVRVFHKENGGVSSARALGVKEAKGEYSIHVDPDDYIVVNMLEDMVEKAQELDCDVLMCDYYEKKGDVVIYNKQQPKSLSSKEILKEMLVCDIHGSLCNKLVKHRLYEEFDLKFYENINCREDLLIWVQLFTKDISVSYINKAYYYYCDVNLDSLSKFENIENTLFVISKIKFFLKPYKTYNDSILFNELLYYIMHYTNDTLSLKMFKKLWTFGHTMVFLKSDYSWRSKLIILIKRYFYF